MILAAKDPHHILNRVRRQLRTQGQYLGDNPWEDALARGLTGDVDIPEELGEALALYTDVEHRNIVESLLLCGATDGDIKECLDIPLEVTRKYRQLIFDPTVFKTRLDKTRYADNCSEDQGQRLMLRGLKEGLECLKLEFGGGGYNVSAISMLQKQLNKAYAMMCDIDPTDVTTDMAKEVRHWALSSTKAVSQMPTALDVSNTENSETLVFALEARADELAAKAAEDSSEPINIMTGQEVDDVQ